VKPAAVQPTTPARRPAILTPWVDAVCIGGGSILLFLPLLLTGDASLLLPAEKMAWITMLVNTPHFMASYRMVYRSREMILRHKWASIYVPAGLIAYAVFAVAMSPVTPRYVVLMLIVSSTYLAWHYTGQAWGMMASYTYLAGAAFQPLERTLIRLGLRMLLIWHVTWFLYLGTSDPWMRDIMEPAYHFMSWTTVLSFALGVTGLVQFARRTGRLPPVNVLVAWVAIYFWYAGMARDQRAIYWVQIFHALQYLIFPARVEMNRCALDAASRPPPVGRHMLYYVAGLLLATVLVDKVLPNAGEQIVAHLFGAAQGQAVPLVMLGFLNIHHYFTDGCVWKISNPSVRQELFAHVPKRAPAVS